MNAFADAMAALVADPNLGVDAIYRQSATGPALAVPVTLFFTVAGSPLA